MTIEQVKNIQYGTIVHFVGDGQCLRTVGPRGGVTEKVIRARVFGQVKTWKRDANRVSVPIKHGLRTYGYLTEANCHLFHTEADCPVA